MPQPAKTAARRTEADEVAQRVVGRQFNQRRRSADFDADRRSHLVELLAIEATRRFDAGTMNHPVNGAAGFANPRQYGRQRITIAHVTTVISRFHTRFGKPAKRLIDLDGTFHFVPNDCRDLAFFEGFGDDCPFEVLEVRFGVLSPDRVGLRCRTGTEQVHSQSEPTAKFQCDHSRDTACPAGHHPRSASGNVNGCQDRRRLGHGVNDAAPPAEVADFQLRRPGSQFVTDRCRQILRRLLKTSVHNLNGHAR